MFGSLLPFLADTLAAHQLGGFKVGVGFSLRKCCNCLATAEQMNEYVSVIIHIVLNYYTFTCIISFVITYIFLSCSPDLHLYHCSLIRGCLTDFNSTTYGVNYRSSINEIPLFNVADWQLPQDVIHVLLEGVLALELKLLLDYLISINAFIVSHLNVRIASFQYWYTSAGTKPSTIDPTHLSQHGKLRQNSKFYSLL